jgi:hypothetical protein
MVVAHQQVMGISHHSDQMSRWNDGEWIYCLRNYCEPFCCEARDVATARWSHWWTGAVGKQARANAVVHAMADRVRGDALQLADWKAHEATRGI